MATSIIMPQMSLTMQVGVISQWFKHEGDFVEKGEAICTIEGDKAVIDIEAPTSGYLIKIFAEAGIEFPVKNVMAVIGEKGEQFISEPSGQTVNFTQQSTYFAQSTTTSGEHDRIKASPIAKRYAQELGIDLSKINGSGPDGLINREDVIEASEKSKELEINNEQQSVQRSNVQRIVAEKMAESNREIPHFHLSIDIWMDGIEKIRSDWNKDKARSVHITVTDLLIWAISRALKLHPEINAFYSNGKITLFPSINIGFAVAAKNGLIVPVIAGADTLLISEIAEKRVLLVDRVKNGKQSSKDLENCTFTVSNLGMYGILSFDPIITPGQAAVLGTGAIHPEVSLNEQGELKLHQSIVLTLGGDHRVFDGVEGASFLSSIKLLLEDPKELFDAE